MFGHDDNSSQQQHDDGTNGAELPMPDTGMAGSDPVTPGAPAAPASDAPADVAAGDYIMTDPASGDAQSTVPAVPEDLLNIKQQALQQLTPLVGHLEQTPEEEFRTTMMMIQASDNQALIKTAYEAAQKITDEKARARALLDIVNEINYFTQHQDSES